MATFVSSDKDKSSVKGVAVVGFAFSEEGNAVVGFAFSEEGNAVVLFVAFEEDKAVYGDIASDEGGAVVLSAVLDVYEVPGEDNAIGCDEALGEGSGAASVDDNDAADVTDDVLVLVVIYLIPYILYSTILYLLKYYYSLNRTIG